MTEVLTERREIPITRPVIGAEEYEALRAPLESGWLVQGPCVDRFERAFAAFCGAQHGIATTSCTTALHLAVAALGLKPGDEVIVPAFTWIATANVVEYMGATPVFADVDLATFNLEPAQVGARITERTVGMIPVHLFGLSADMDPLLELARQRGLWIVEDAACGFGSMYHGRHVGTFGRAGCFSFHPRKSITTGEGGMITTDDPEMARLTRCLRDHGASRTDLDRHREKAAFLLAEYRHLGYNYRMTDLQAAVGCAQMTRADWILERRRALAAEYDRLLAGLDWLATPHVPAGYVHGYQAYVCLFRPEAPTLPSMARSHGLRNEVMARLEQRGIATRQGTHAVIGTDYYRERYRLEGRDFAHATLAEHLSLALPLYPQMTASDQEFVVTSLLGAWDEVRGGTAS